MEQDVMGVENPRGVLQGLLEEREALVRQLKDMDVVISFFRRRVEGMMMPASLPSPQAADEPDSTDAPASEVSEGGPKMEGRYAGMTNPDAAKAYLRAVGRPQKTAQIMKALEAGGIESTAKDFRSTLYTTLARLADAGDVLNVGPGLWEIAPASEDGSGKGEEQLSMED